MAEDIGERLQRARKALKLSREVVAERLKLSVAAVQHHESGKNDPTLQNIKKYSRMYRISTDWMLLGKGRGPGETSSPEDAVLEVWANIPPSRQPQALLVLQTFLSKEKESA